MAERYEIRSKIGQGGVGAVYRAFDTQLQRMVAIKRLLPVDESELDEAPDAMLAKEAALMSSLSHPNIISVYDAGTDTDGAFVVMEFIDGETLEDTVRRTALTENDFVSLAEQCLDGLIAAQAVGLLHRDIKPSNIMLRWLPSGKFQVKIVDFGLAKLSFKPTIQTIDHGDAILGSIFFLAPEQFERLPLDKRVDLYALGCVLYYSLTQGYPFQGDTAAAVMMSHLEHKVTDISQLRPDLPEPLARWLMRLFARDMDDRPNDAESAMAELVGAIKGVVPEGAPQIVVDDGATASAIPVPEEASPPGEVIPEAIPVTSTSRLVTARNTSAARRMVTGAQPTVGADEVKQTLQTRPVSTRITKTGQVSTSTRINQLPGDPSAQARQTMAKIFAIILPLAIALFFLGRCALKDPKKYDSTTQQEPTEAQETPAEKPLPLPYPRSLSADFNSRVNLPYADREKIQRANETAVMAVWEAADQKAFFSTDKTGPAMFLFEKSEFVSSDRQVLRFKTANYIYTGGLGSAQLISALGGGGVTVAVVINPSADKSKVWNIGYIRPKRTSWSLECNLQENGKTLTFTQAAQRDQKVTRLSSSPSPVGWSVVVASINYRTGAMEMVVSDRDGKLEVVDTQSTAPLGEVKIRGLDIGQGGNQIPGFGGDLSRVVVYKQALSRAEMQVVADRMHTSWMSSEVTE